MKLVTPLLTLLMVTVSQLVFAQCSQSTLIITMITDDYGYETSWSVQEQNGAIVDSVSSFTYSSNTTSIDTVCLDPTKCYTFTINDINGDGICCFYGLGSYSVSLNGNIVASGGSFGGTETTNLFGVCPALVPPLKVDTSTYSPAQLVTDILFGTGFNISNITYSGTAAQIGYFYDAGPLGFDRGILLTSGTAKGAIGPNLVSNESGQPGTPGDSILDASMGGVFNSLDACVLEFDILPTTNEVSLRYIFASEEYPEYVCSNYNDAFGFFVTGSGYTPNTNVALIPNTSTRVAINSVNGGAAGAMAPFPPTCTSVTNDSLFVLNTPGYGTEYDGYTVPLTARISVVPNTLYHIRLVVADFSDRMYDSGIFLEAQSFTAQVRHDSLSICPGDSAFAGGAWQTAAGIYNDTFTAVNGADSIVITHLDIANITYQQTASICQGDSFYFANQWRSVAGTYLDTFVSSLGCDSVVALQLVATSTITTSLTAFICQGDSSFAGGAWQTLPGAYADTLIASGGCDSIATTLLTVDSSLVWPGDANNDMIANNLDLLAIGLSFGETGIARDSLSYIWQGHCAENWNAAQSNGANKKHADCNGDGLIGRTDTLALNINYTRTHSKGAPPAPGAGAVLTLVPRSSTYFPGDTVILDIVAGDNTTTVQDLYGLGFSLSFDNSLMLPGSAQLYYPNGWMGNVSDNLKLAMVFQDDGKAEGAITKKDHQNVSGYGIIGVLQFIADSTINSLQTSTVSITSYTAVDAQGAPVLFSTQAGTFSIDGTSGAGGTFNRLNSLKIYPNPFTLSATIEFSLKREADVSLRVYDVLGIEIFEKSQTNYPSGTHQLHFENSLSGKGVFIIELDIDGSKVRRRLVQIN